MGDFFFLIFLFMMMMVEWQAAAQASAKCERRRGGMSVANVSAIFFKRWSSVFKVFCPLWCLQYPFQGMKIATFSSTSFTVTVYKIIMSVTVARHRMIQYALNIYTSTKSWRGYIFTAVCLCVCVSVCVSNFLVNKIPAERMHRFGRGFR